jgi:hypothetical protein
MRQVIISVKDSQVSFNKAALGSLISSLEDGEYQIEIHSLSKMTPRGCQKAYFLLVEIVTNHTGHTKTEIHEMFKREHEIGTTKGLSTEQWLEIIAQFKSWVFNELEIIL